jgi:hypothetical protein
MCKLKNDPGLMDLCRLVWDARVAGRMLAAATAITERWTVDQVHQAAATDPGDHDSDSDLSDDDDRRDGAANRVGCKWRGDTFLDSWEEVVQVGGA